MAVGGILSEELCGLDKGDDNHGEIDPEGHEARKLGAVHEFSAEYQGIGDGKEVDELNKLINPVQHQQNFGIRIYINNRTFHMKKIALI
jgi:hypothetical protein